MSETPSGADTVTIRVLRQSAESAGGGNDGGGSGGGGGSARYQTYRVEAFPRMSVLDALFAIQRGQDRSLAFRYSCRIGMCGTCAVIVNGREGLACQTLVERFPGGELSVRPLNYMPVIKDLAVDMAPFFERYQAVKPAFVADEATAAATEPLVIAQAAGQRTWVDPALGCISCGICFSSCSVVGTTPGFPGPAALNRALTLVNDERDALRDERLAATGGDDGVWRCHQMFNCASACPRHISPTRAIRELRQAYVGAQPNPLAPLVALTPLAAPLRWIARKLRPDGPSTSSNPDGPPIPSNPDGPSTGPGTARRR